MVRDRDDMAFQSAWLPQEALNHRNWAVESICSSTRHFVPLPNISKSLLPSTRPFRMSGIGNGTESADAGEANDMNSKSPGPSGPAIAKEKLTRIISELVNDDSQIQEVERLILHLESLRATPITDSFTEMGLAGTWKLVFSSTRTRPGGNVRIRKIDQSFDTEKKLMINKAKWSFAAKNGVDQIGAELLVICSYKFVGPGRLEVDIQEHKVKIVENKDGKKQDLPDDLQALLAELQVSLPPDFFDPSGLIDVSYMEPDFRLARFVGKRRAGVRNVFIRD